MQEWSETMGTFDEVSMERSKSFVKALQELKNLRPQLYSAAEYCEKSYLHNEQKQMVLENLKDYTVRALVNAVDHLGTVAYKLTDLFEQQTIDVSSVELKISCLNQRIRTCQTCVDLEGLKQQQLLTKAPRHHKHYILPSLSTRKAPGNTQLAGDPLQNQTKAVPRPHPPGTPASKTLSWHLASEDNPALIGTASSGVVDSRVPKVASETFHLVGGGQTGLPLPLSTHLQSVGRTPMSNSVAKSSGGRELAEVSKQLSAFKSFDNPGRREIIRAPARSKSMLSVFFAKNRTFKQKKANGI